MELSKKVTDFRLFTAAESVSFQNKKDSKLIKIIQKTIKKQTNNQTKCIMGIFRKRNRLVSSPSVWNYSTCMLCIDFKTSIKNNSEQTHRFIFDLHKQNLQAMPTSYYNHSRLDVRGEF